jgi:hypothetical protein
MTQTVEDLLGCSNALDLVTTWSHWFFYGATGTGKTRMASTFPRPIFLVPQNEKSITTLRQQNILYYEIVDMKASKLNPKTGRGSMESVIDRLEKVYFSSPDNCPFDTIVCESISHFTDLAVEELTDGAQKQMNQQQWGVLASHLRNIQTRLRAMDVNAVFTALDTTEQSEDGKVVLGRPLIPGQAAQKLPSACDVIGHCEVLTGGKGGNIYRVHFRDHKWFPARSRFPGLPDKVDNFEYAKIQHLLAAT